MDRFLLINVFVAVVDTNGFAGAARKLNLSQPAVTGVPADIVAALRNNTPIENTKLEALHQFTNVMVNSRGWPEAKDVQAFIAAGYNQQTVLEVVLGISLKGMSNYTNHVVQTPVDGVFAAHAWTTTTTVN